MGAWRWAKVTYSRDELPAEALGHYWGESLAR